MPRALAAHDPQMTRTLRRFSSFQRAVRRRRRGGMRRADDSGQVGGLQPLSVCCDSCRAGPARRARARRVTAAVFPRLSANRRPPSKSGRSAGPAPTGWSTIGRVARQTASGPRRPCAHGGCRPVTKAGRRRRATDFDRDQRRSRASLSTGPSGDVCGCEWSLDFSAFQRCWTFR